MLVTHYWHYSVLQSKAPITQRMVSEQPLDCCAAVDRINIPRFFAHGVNLRVRIGVSTAKFSSVTLALKRHMTYSAIGDHVNIASRLENLNKIYGTSVLVNETTYMFAKHELNGDKSTGQL